MPDRNLNTASQPAAAPGTPGSSPPGSAMRGRSIGAAVRLLHVLLVVSVVVPVLAWGLGIERLAMIRFGVSDIRELYGTSLNELEKVPLCR